MEHKLLTRGSNNETKNRVNNTRKGSQAVPNIGHGDADTYYADSS